MFDNYIAQYGQRLYGLCRTLCASPADADDLYQATWLRALERFDRYDRNRAFEPWLTAICVNLFRSQQRRLRRSPVYDGFASSEDKQLLLEQTPEPEQTDYSDLHAAVDALPEPLRLAVILFYFHDLDLVQTAQTLNVPLGTAKSRLSRAKKRLKEVLRNAESLQF
ncbi:MAG: sigma-70 family RNA polymerase sigma factor [Ruminococcaceae bacterium]|nr:sigma-70 family RNA polymerase sigma factor [Oscillospiraceae bacterium]